MYSNVMKHIVIGVLLILKGIRSFEMKPFPLMKNIWTGNSRLVPFWTPLDFTHNINKPKSVILDNEPFVCYRNKNNSIILHFDNCPHQGAKLSAGKLVDDNLICPYHGFKFYEGRYNGLPLSTKKCNSPLYIPRIPTLTKNDITYFLPFTDIYNNDNLECKLVPDPYIAPEENDPNFSKISGKVVIHKNCEIVTENILDMLHISFVHSFGNANAPLPYKIHFTKLDDYSGRTTFMYKAADNTLSRNLGDAKEVIVENEYYLPSTTVTRVKANKIIKTVVTRTVPINENESILFWEVHRNFVNENHITRRIGDIIMRLLMERTLLEDIEILKHVNEKYRIGCLNTKFDITILNYRKAKNKFYHH